MSDTVTVCSECLKASCWQGIFYCDDYKAAGTVEKTIHELKALALEHPSYWKAQPVKFREHRGSLGDSLATMVKLKDRAELIAHCTKLLAPYDFHFTQLHVYRYVLDKRIDWDTHIVMIPGYGPIGFTDGPCE